MKQVINVKKLKTDQEITQVANHNLRQVPSRNVSKSRTHNNRFFIGSPKTDVAGELAKKLEGLPKFRKDANRMVNLVLSASPEFFETATKKQIIEWENATQKWAEDTFGKENIIYSVVHHDEMTPHFHIALVPIFEGKLRSNHWFDGPAKLKKLHDSYAKVNKNFGIRRGQKQVKSSQEELQNFYQKVNASTVYEMQMEKKLDGLFEKINNPSPWQRLRPWLFFDDVVKPLMTELSKHLSHYRTKAKNLEHYKKDLAEAQERISDLELKMETLGFDPNISHIQCEKYSHEVKVAIAEKRPLQVDGVGVSGNIQTVFNKPEKPSRNKNVYK